jgi:hypothetical protein
MDMDKGYNAVVFLIAFSLIFLVVNLDNRSSHGQPASPIANNVTSDIIDILSNDFETLPNQTSANKSNLTQNSTDSANLESIVAETFIPPTIIFLEGLSIPEGESMFIYSSSPYSIDKADITGKLPCNEDGLSPVSVILGNVSNFRNATIESIFEPFSSAELCTYRIVLDSRTSNPVSEIILQNNSTDDIEFPSTSNIIVGPAKVNMASNATK